LNLTNEFPDREKLPPSSDSQSSLIKA